MSAYIGTGRRKTAVARVRINMQGSGKVLVNKRPFETYFASELQRQDVMRPLEVVNMAGSVDVSVTTNGGGIAGQAGAMRLGIARALVAFNSELKPALRHADLLTRDPRMVERKKYGRKKARKRFQFSKR